MFVVRATGTAWQARRYLLSTLTLEATKKRTLAELWRSRRSPLQVHSPHRPGQCSVNHPDAALFGDAVNTAEANKSA